MGLFGSKKQQRNGSPLPPPVQDPAIPLQNSSASPASQAPAPAQASAQNTVPASEGDYSDREANSFGSTDRSVQSVHSQEPSHSAGSDAVRDIKCDILANWLYTKQEEKLWTGRTPGEGVFVKKSKGNYACAPVQLLNDDSNLYHAITELNARVGYMIPSISSYTADNFGVRFDCQFENHKVCALTHRGALCPDPVWASTTGHS